MNAVTTAPADSRRAQRRRERPSVCSQAVQDAGKGRRVGGAPAGGGLTLEQRLESVWEGLRAAGVAECPICQGELRAGAPGTAALCVRCGSSLS